MQGNLEALIIDDDPPNGERLYEKPCFEGFVPKPLTVGKLDDLLKQIGVR